MPSASIKTPCIGVCSTGIGDTVCRGCKRFAHEIIHWNGYSEVERRAVVNRLEALLAQVVQDFIFIVDEQKLHRQIKHQQIRIANREASNYCLAFEAIRQLGRRLPSLADIGCAAQTGRKFDSMVDLKITIDEAFFKLSSAHYERYFAGAL